MCVFWLVWFGLFMFYCFNFIRQWLESLQHFNWSRLNFIGPWVLLPLLETATHINTYLSLCVWGFSFHSFVRSFRFACVSGKHWECHPPRALLHVQSNGLGFHFTLGVSSSALIHFWHSIHSSVQLNWIQYRVAK